MAPFEVDATARARTGAQGGSDPVPGTAASTRHWRRAVLAGALCVAVLAPAALATARYPRWWSWIAPEQTPMTWLQSVVLVLAAATSALLLLLSRWEAWHRTWRRSFLILTLGFLALALDERFAVHERIRDGYLAPRDVRIPVLPWVGPGDFLLVGVAVVGLALLPGVLRAMRPEPTALRLFIAGVVLAALAVAADSVDPTSWSTSLERWEQTLEECVELAAGLCLLSAMLWRLLAALEASVLAVPGPSGGSTQTGQSRTLDGGG